MALRSGSIPRSSSVQQTVLVLHGGERSEVVQDRIAVEDIKHTVSIVSRVAHSVLRKLR